MSAQHIMLDALVAEAERLITEGRLDPEVYEGEPVSHTFYPGDEPWDEDDVASIKAVGQQDVSRKLAYWQRVIDTMQHDKSDPGPAYSDGGEAAYFASYGGHLE